MEVKIFRHCRGIPTDWKWWFFVTDGGSQLTGSDDFSSLTGDPKWPFWCLDFPTFWFLFFSQFQMTGSVDFSLLAGGPNWPFGCLDLSVSFCNIFVRSLSARLFVLLIERLVAVYIISNIKSTNFLYSPLHHSFNSFISHISKKSTKKMFFFAGIIPN